MVRVGTISVAAGRSAPFFGWGTDVIQPINRESLLDFRLIEPVPVRAVTSHVSTGVDEGQPSIPAHGTVLGIGGGALTVLGVLILLSALVALPGRAK